MGKFRIHFLRYGNSPEGYDDRYCVQKDVEAKTSDEVFHLAYKMPEAKCSDEVMVEDFPEGPSTIGIEFTSIDTRIKRNFSGYVFIRAMNEEQAVEYYNSHIKGKHYWFNTSEIDETGKCVFGKIKKTYFAAVNGCNYDATKAASI